MLNLLVRSKKHTPRCWISFKNKPYTKIPLTKSFMISIIYAEFSKESRAGVSRYKY